MRRPSITASLLRGGGGCQRVWDRWGPSLVSNIFCRGLCWRVDAGRFRLGWVHWPCVGESFRVAIVGLVEHALSPLDDLRGHAVMEHIGCQQRDSAVMVFVVIPREKALAKAPRVFDGPESVGELGPVLESFELALRVRVIV